MFRARSADLRRPRAGETSGFTPSWGPKVAHYEWATTPTGLDELLTEGVTGQVRYGANAKLAAQPCSSAFYGLPRYSQRKGSLLRRVTFCGELQNHPFKVREACRGRARPLL